MEQLTKSQKSCLLGVFTGRSPDNVPSDRTIDWLVDNYGGTRRLWWRKSRKFHKTAMSLVSLGLLSMSEHGFEVTEKGREIARQNVDDGSLSWDVSMGPGFPGHMDAIIRLPDGLAVTDALAWWLGERVSGATIYSTSSGARVVGLEPHCGVLTAREQREVLSLLAAHAAEPLAIPEHAQRRGRRPLGGQRRLSVTVRLAPDVMAWLREQGGSLSSVVEAALRNTMEVGNGVGV